MRTPVLALALALALALVAPGCFGGEAGALEGLVPYPRIGDVATYEATGALVDIARWENGVPFAAPSAQVRLTLDASPDALDGARAQHPAFKLTTEIAEAGIFVKKSERFVSVRHQAIVQSYHPLSQDQSIVAFDERGFPWLWGASALIGEELREGARIPLALPDNLGRGQTMEGAWAVTGREGDLWVLTLEGLAGLEGTLWTSGVTAWPERVRLSLASDALAPHVRSDGGYSVTIEARLASLTQGGDAVAPRDRGASFGTDSSALRARWDGEKPPDGDASVFEYALGAAVADAKLLDKPLQDWLAAADAPILYRGTYQIEAGPLEGSTSALWLLQWVDRGDAYYEVQISKLFAPPLDTPAPLPPEITGAGIPRVESSAPAAAPEGENHGWFDPASLPEQLVPLSEGVRIVRDTFGATDVQIFLRSFADPPGYSYFLDGGFEEGGVGRYTVVYHPSTGFIEEATGPVTPRLA